MAYLTECGYLVGLNTFTSPDDRGTDFFSLSAELVEAELRGESLRRFGHRCGLIGERRSRRNSTAKAVSAGQACADTQQGWAYVLALLAAVILSVRSYAAGKSRWLEQSSSQISADRPVGGR